MSGAAAVRRRQEAVRRRSWVRRERLPHRLGAIVALRADHGVTLVSGAASEWNDRFGSGRNVTQGTDTRRPTLVATGAPGGGPYLQFDGVDDMLRGTWTWNQPEHVFAVMRPHSAATATRTCFDGAAGDSMRVYIHSDTTRMAQHAGLDEINVVADPTAWHRFECLFNGAASALTVDGVRAAGNNNANSGGLCLGLYGNQAAVPTALRIAELVGFNRALTAHESGCLNDQIRRRYGFAA